MAWVTLTEDDVLTSLNDREVETYRARIADGQADPIAGILADVTSEVRGYVATRHSITAAGIPPGLKNAAIDISIYRLAKRLHTASEQQRKSAADDARDLLNKVANGDVAIEDDAGSAVTPAPSICARDAEFKRSQQDGI